MKEIIFHKYQGNGNDFIIIDSRNSDIYNQYLSHNLFNVNDLCRRNFGIGADGIIFVLSSKDSNDVKMKIYNSDGSEAEMCGNGIRCLIKYLYNDQDIAKANKKKNYIYTVETKAGVKVANYKNGKISIKMGAPILEPKLIPTTINKFIKNIPYATFKINNFNNLGYAIGMGNPHLIFFVDDLSKVNHCELGADLERNILFPERTNVHFCQVLNSNNIKVNVWERGSGETLACGTGACAVHVAAHKLGICNNKTKITLPGGSLIIEWNENYKEVIMIGDAKKVFKGSFFIK
ncbi:MAG: diaminopimelate epimerase [Prochlorococcus sp. SP3034]|nr:diaminopimelate epimerase [Prochlorococcus sp. SP3034]|tara:strand:- start:7884 stop:8756 length:873 start_codon:yes stop_codon:yes gene_type:complete